jgi:hypothetical protein
VFHGPSYPGAVPVHQPEAAGCLHLTLPRALPYESSWTGANDPIARQTATDEVIRFYRDNEFSVADDFRDLPDHIAAELEFVYALLFGEAAAQNAGDDRGSAEAAAIRRSFVSLHLGRWSALLRSDTRGSRHAFLQIDCQSHRKVRRVRASVEDRHGEQL